MAQPSQSTTGQAKVAAYGEFVDWEKRLAREAPFFRRTFESVGARSVIDVGAGTAMHAILFAVWGMSVEAVDPDDSMLEQAEANIAGRAEEIALAGGEVRLQRGGFGELSQMGLGPADALVCTGNALPHVAGVAGLRSALADFAAVLRPGGVLVLHLLNHARLLEKRVRAIPPVVRDTDDGVKVFLRVIEYPETAEGTVEFIDFDFVTLVRPAEGGEWTTASRRSLHTALPLELLESELAAAGFRDVTAFGDHSGRALDLAADESMIVTALR
jgi:SAM-dependent methyltransferase